MIGLASNFASSLPKVDIAPSGLFNIGGVNITNSILLGWISAVLMIVFFIWVARRITVHPKGGIIQIVEVVADFIVGTTVDAFSKKERAQKYVLYFTTIFFFILVNNLLGLIPGVGYSLAYHGQDLLRPATADFNTTLAMAVVTMGIVYIFSVKEIGLKHFAGHFFMGSIKNPLYLFIGLIEIITDMTRVISLSLRLFLNISIVSLIVVVFAWLGHIIAPVSATPFYFLDFFDDLLQAYIFALLGVMYLAIAVNHVDDSGHEGLTEEATSEKMELSSVA